MSNEPTQSRTEDLFGSFLNMLWAVCKRPDMYTVGSSAFEIWAFIHGVESGMFLKSPIATYPLSSLARWLADRFAIEDSCIWHVTLNENPDLFSNMSPEEIWTLLMAYFRDVHGIEYEPIQIEPCSYSESARRTR